MATLDIFLHSSETIVTFLLIGVLGYYLAKRGWFDGDSSVMLSRLLAKIIIPLNLLYNIETSMTREIFLANASSIPMPVLAQILSIGAGWVVATLVKVPQRHKSIFIVTFACSSTMNIGLPINLALFGDTAITAILMYYMSNTIIFWTIGNSMLAADSPVQKQVPMLSLPGVKRMFSPSLMAGVIGAGMLLAGISLPGVIENAMKHVGNMVTPVSTMCIGIAIFETGWKNIKLTREVGLLCLGRFIIAPVILAVLLWFSPVEALTYKVFMIQASLPPPPTVALLAIFYKTDAEYASVSISFATLCALVTVPVYMMLLG